MVSFALNLCTTVFKPLLSAIAWIRIFCLARSPMELGTHINHSCQALGQQSLLRNTLLELDIGHLSQLYKSFTEIQ